MKTTCILLMILSILILGACSPAKTTLKAENYQYHQEKILNFDLSALDVVKLNEKVNSNSFDYGPIICKNDSQLIFISNRKGSKLPNSEVVVAEMQRQLLDVLEGRTSTIYIAPSHDFWVINMEYGYPVGKAYYLDSVYNSKLSSEFNEGLCAVTKNSDLILYSHLNGNNDDPGGDILFSHLESNRTWSVPHSMGENINTEFYESHPTVSDAGGTIYFMSNRHDEWGKDGSIHKNSENNDPFDTDLWLSKDRDQPICVLPLNTYGAEKSPYILEDNVTIIFASDSHRPNYGGSDFYISRYDPFSEKWSKPENLGPKINSEDNEIGISVDSAGELIYFSSDREKNGNMNIYRAELPKSILKK